MAGEAFGAGNDCDTDAYQNYLDGAGMRVGTAMEPRNQPRDSDV